MIENIKRIVIRGTPRIVSMKIVEKTLTTGSDDRLPNAKANPIGKERIMPPAESIIVTSKPPHNVVATLGIILLLDNPARRIRETTGTIAQPIVIALALTAGIRPIK
jgi:type II secretory pathway component GspD/PulD (secretin)